MNIRLPSSLFLAVMIFNNQLAFGAIAPGGIGDGSSLSVTPTNGTARCFDVVPLACPSDRNGFRWTLMGPKAFSNFSSAI